MEAADGDFQAVTNISADFWQYSISRKFTTVKI